MIFKSKKQKRKDVAVGLDLGCRQIKAAIVRREAAGYQLAEYAVISPLESLRKGGGTDLQGLIEKLAFHDRSVRVAISCGSGTVSEVELPRMSIPDVRAALKLNGQRYLRRDLANYLLDAVELVEPTQDPKAEASPKMRVLVAAASEDEVRWCRDALVAAKTRPEVIELSAIAVVNAFQLCNPEACAKGVVLLLDIGAAATSISFLRNGLPTMTRIMNFGGDQITEFVGQILTLQPAAAEAEKLKMSDEIKPLIRQALTPLARDIRASIDFFERQHEARVVAAYACGGTACSPVILEFLTEEVGSRIEVWNPVRTFDTSRFSNEGARLADLAPSLAAAIGSAVVQL